MIGQFGEEVDIWIEMYAKVCAPLIRSKGRGLLVITVEDGECMPTFATLASCNDENLSRLGFNHAEAEIVREILRGYREDSELPVTTVGDGMFRFELIQTADRPIEATLLPWRV